MSIFKRVSNIIRSNKEVPAPAQSGSPLEDARVGDIMNVDLEEYVITGKVIYFDRGFAPHRYAYYLQSGKNMQCLIVEKGRTLDCFLCGFLEGALDDPNDVPTTLNLDDDATFELEFHRSDVTRTEGNTDFRSGDDVIFWRYFGPDQRFFFLQWQDGKFVAMEGERTPGNQIKFLKSTL
ncbi:MULTISPECIES: DUF4178 domain-containing protein [Paenibacillus]|uniref:DUF4178 domain-containing protein n=1 Tax=Paenibacillus whitsoniae TaxID=2496558 RepID=A0A430JET6_9BACL|nr:DUF4178 domain-containing protein [Paenibacillus whitsoniae]RTE09537.1 DUF4178 domain-containing protein [Paenibacillus whitsoniae]